MAEKEVLVTKEGLEQLEAELDNYKNVKRREELKLPSATATSVKTLNMKKPKTNRR